MALRLLLVWIVGIALTIAWWGLYGVVFWEVIDSRLKRLKFRRVAKLLLKAYQFGVPILAAAISLPLRNLGVVLALTSPLWGLYLWDFLNCLASRTEGRRLLGDWIWLYFGFFLVAIVVGYTFLPLLWGDGLHFYGNIEGLFASLNMGAIVGVLTVIGTVVGWKKWKSHGELGGTIGGVVGWLIPLLLLTMEFDSLAVRAGIDLYVSPMWLYAVGFIPASIFMMIAAAIVASLLTEESSSSPNSRDESPHW